MSVRISHSFVFMISDPVNENAKSIGFVTAEKILAG